MVAAASATTALGTTAPHFALPDTAGKAASLDGFRTANAYGAATNVKSRAYCAGPPAFGTLIMIW